MVLKRFSYKLFRKREINARFLSHFRRRRRRCNAFRIRIRIYTLYPFYEVSR